MTTATTKTTKKDELKKAIMTFLNNEVGSVSRKDIDNKVGHIASTRTIARALAELKLNGMLLQQKDGNTFNWVSTEPKTTKKETPAPEKKEITETDKKMAEIKKQAENFDNINIVATGTEFYATGIEKAGKWTARDIFIMDSLKTNYKVDVKETPAPEKETLLNDLSDYDDDYISQIIDDMLFAEEKNPNTENIKNARIVLETTTYLADMKADQDNENKKDKKETPVPEKKEKKEISKKQLIIAGKVTRNASDSGAEKKLKVKISDKKVGVIAIIIKAIIPKHRTKKQILAKLEKVFPERSPEKMMKTINVQVPSRLRKDKGLTIEKTDKGYKIITE